MRLTIPVTIAGALVAAGAAVSLSAPGASAISCPPGTIPRNVTVAGRTVTVCVPGQECDPGPCDPTAAPPRD